MSLAFVFSGLDTPDSVGGRDTSGRVHEPSSRPALRSEADVQLAARIREGDHKAFTTLFLENYDALCRFAESYLRNAADAEEIVEGVLARIWEHRADFDPQAGIGPYLYAAVRNRAFNALRDTRTRQNWEAAHAVDMANAQRAATPESTASLIATLEREELGVVLRRVIDTLPEHRRVVVTMRWFGGLSHAEIAAALGTSVNAVEIQLRRALKELATKVPTYLRE